MTDIRLVLMSCCAPCAAGAIKQLVDATSLGDFEKLGITKISDFIVLFYNPNIYPDTEYQKRLAEQINYCEKLNVKYAIGDYDHGCWLASISGLEKEPEQGSRCSKCFQHRFSFAENFAIKNGYNAITSVFGVSRHKNQAQVDLAAKIIKNITYMPVFWDESVKIDMNRQSDFYRQNYCGCEFSIRK